MEVSESEEKLLQKWKYLTLKKMNVSKRPQNLQNLNSEVQNRVFRLRRAKFSSFLRVFLPAAGDFFGGTSKTLKHWCREYYETWAGELIYQNTEVSSIKILNSLLLVFIYQDYRIFEMTKSTACFIKSFQLEKLKNIEE